MSNSTPYSITIYWSCSSHSILLNNSQELLEVEVTQIGYFRTPLSSEAHFLLCTIIQEQGREMDYWSLTVIESEEQTKTFLSNLLLQQLFEKTFPGTPATCLCWTLNLGETKILFQIQGCLEPAACCLLPPACNGRSFIWHTPFQNIALMPC